jgi:hypothetical protein
MNCHAGTPEPSYEDAMNKQNNTTAAVSGRRRIIGLIISIALSAAGAIPMASAADRHAATFGSPEQAADALAEAWNSGSKRELLKIFGPAGEKLVSSGDPVAEKEARTRLASAYAEQHRIEVEAGRKAVIVMGKDEWSYPIPLIKQGEVWRFDVKAGAQQIIDRRIGRNELNAIKVCHAYVEAQREYAAIDRTGDGVREYARRVASTKGKHDGLYWTALKDEEESPLGPLAAAAEAQGYSAASAEGRKPFHGYLYRILTRQGENAHGGAQDYVVEGHLAGGFALVAFPATYGDSGVMTFIINQHGIVFEKNLGANTAKIARRMKAYDPDPTWKVVQK